MRYQVPKVPDREKPRFVAGLDLGQKADSSALALAKVFPSPASRPGRNLDLVRIVGLKRYPLRTPYPQIVASVVATMREPALHCDVTDPSIDMLPIPKLLIDSTGVGAATTDLFLAAEIPATVVPITITAGSTAREGRWNNSRTTAWYVPKVDLVGSALTLLEAGRLEIVRDMPEADVLLAELRNFKVKVTAAGNQTYEAGGVGVDGHREGVHDDLLLAVAMIAWEVNRPRIDRTVRRGPPLLPGYRG